MERFDAADAFFANTGAEIRFGGNKAFYSPAGDFIACPLFEAFESPESFVSVVAHELGFTASVLPVAAQAGRA
nr:zincin-like metallopeptidase domain-containing protein [Mesorhizobium sp.]